MVLLIRVFIEGRPRPQPRHYGTGPKAFVPADNPVHGWRQAVTVHVLNEWNRFRLSESPGPIGLRLVFQMPRPKSHGRRDQRPNLHTIRPDLDNLEKAVKDAMRDIWTDDCVVAAVWKEKRWADGPAGLDLEVHALEDSPTRIPRICLSRPG